MTQYSKEDARAALRIFREGHGHEAVAKLLKRVAGVDRFDQLSETHFAAVVNATKSGGGAASGIISTQARLNAVAQAYWDAKAAGRGRTRGRGGRGGQGGGHDDASE
jgi:hypothetical protein